MKTLYIDIDGVLVDSKAKKAALNAENFIKFIINNFDCYWLSTHCRDGIEWVITYLSRYYDIKTMELLKKIKPTQWNAMKTDAIEMNDDWYWIDDAPLSIEFNILKRHGLENRLLIVEPDKGIGLKEIQSILEEKLKS
jgi:hypothetical protein